MNELGSSSNSSSLFSTFSMIPRFQQLLFIFSCLFYVLGLQSLLSHNSVRSWDYTLIQCPNLSLLYYYLIIHCWLQLARLLLHCNRNYILQLSQPVYYTIRLIHAIILIQELIFANIAIMKIDKTCSFFSKFCYYAGSSALFAVYSVIVLWIYTVLPIIKLIKIAQQNGFNECITEVVSIINNLNLPHSSISNSPHEKRRPHHYRKSSATHNNYYDTSSTSDTSSEIEELAYNEENQIAKPQQNVDIIHHNSTSNKINSNDNDKEDEEAINEPEKITSARNNRGDNSNNQPAINSTDNASEADNSSNQRQLSPLGNKSTNQLSEQQIISTNTVNETINNNSGVTLTKEEDNTGGVGNSSILDNNQKPSNPNNGSDEFAFLRISRPLSNSINSNNHSRTHSISSQHTDKSIENNKSPTLSAAAPEFQPILSSIALNSNSQSSHSNANDTNSNTAWPESAPQPVKLGKKARKTLNRKAREAAAEAAQVMLLPQISNQLLIDLQNNFAQVPLTNPVNPNTVNYDIAPTLPLEPYVVNNNINYNANTIIKTSINRVNPPHHHVALVRSKLDEDDNIEGLKHKYNITQEMRSTVISYVTNPASNLFRLPPTIYQCNVKDIDNMINCNRGSLTSLMNRLKELTINNTDIINNTPKYYTNIRNLSNEIEVIERKQLNKSRRLLLEFFNHPHCHLFEHIQLLKVTQNELDLVLSFNIELKYLFNYLRKLNEMNININSITNLYHLLNIYIEKDNANQKEKLLKDELNAINNNYITLKNEIKNIQQAHKLQIQQYQTQLLLYQQQSNTLANNYLQLQQQAAAAVVQVQQQAQQAQLQQAIIQAAVAKVVNNTNNNANSVIPNTNIINNPIEHAYSMNTISNYHDNVNNMGATNVNSLSSEIHENNVNNNNFDTISDNSDNTTGSNNSINVGLDNSDNIKDDVHNNKEVNSSKGINNNNSLASVNSHNVYIDSNLAVTNNSVNTPVVARPNVRPKLSNPVKQYH